jgi:hypothetical protein
MPDKQIGYACEEDVRESDELLGRTLRVAILAV